VYLVESGRLRRKEIKPGISDDTQLEIVDGLMENDTVALPGDAPLQDGMAVRLDSAK
jgi:hypothetical protein